MANSMILHGKNQKNRLFLYTDHPNFSEKRAKWTAKYGMQN